MPRTRRWMVVAAAIFATHRRFCTRSELSQASLRALLRPEPGPGPQPGPESDDTVAGSLLSEVKNVLERVRC